MKRVTFYFDVISPYAYLATVKIPDFIRRTGTSMEPVPVLFAGLLNHWRQEGPAEIPFMRAYTWKDAMRLAAYHGRKVIGPPAHPFNPLGALRLCAAVEDPKERFTLAMALMKTAWEEGKDLADAAVLESVVEALGWKGRGLIAKTQDPSVKETLKRNTEEAIARGVFGVPTFYVDGEIFWGQDRMEVLEKHLLGQLPFDEGLYQNMLQRPRGIDRKR